ncbi:MAG: hypothetical protein HZA93_00090 [Verrucomicrobia bacterium]|nr:hypothetical protein [Verrucomicrobiota bacterium]
MSATEIIAELPKLDHQQRRTIARRLFELESEAQLLADADRHLGVHLGGSQLAPNALRFEAFDLVGPATGPDLQSQNAP